jgi:hypothetical protein
LPPRACASRMPMPRTPSAPPRVTGCSRAVIASARGSNLACLDPGARRLSRQAGSPSRSCCASTATRPPVWASGTLAGDGRPRTARRRPAGMAWETWISPSPSRAARRLMASTPGRAAIVCHSWRAGRAASRRGP